MSNIPNYARFGDQPKLGLSLGFLFIDYHKGHLAVLVVSYVDIGVTMFTYLSNFEPWMNLRHFCTARGQCIRSFTLDE